MAQKSITLSFDSSWVLSKRNDDVLPIQAFLQHLQALYQHEVLDVSLTECQVVICAEVTDEELLAQIHKILTEKMGVTDPKSVATVQLADYVPETPAEEPSAEEKTAQEEEKSENNGVDKVMEKIENLIGAEEFKALARECVLVAPGLIKNNAVDAFMHQCYLFSVNGGCGASTYLQLFAELLSALKLCAIKPTAIREVKPAPPGGREPNPFESVYKSIGMRTSEEKRLVCIDISEWMTNVSDQNFRQLLELLDRRMQNIIVVFRIPFVEKAVRDNLRRGIGDILFVRELSFVPFSGEELCAYMERAAKAKGFRVEPDVRELFTARLAEEKSDGRFYGINTVNKILFEMLYRKHLHNARAGVLDTVIKKEELTELVTASEDLELSGLEQLDHFVGMEKIKARVEEIVAQIEMAQKNENLGSPCIHMRFVGNPGTGKTTVARIVGKVLREKGILRNGSFFEHSGRDFCGRYVGETAPKTAALCRDAYGSVLFIDEAYSLYRSESLSDADYGQEAIDTLIAQMENHRNDMVVIMAGYPEEMQTLMKANAGLESRMPYIVEFPNYTREQLAEIFMIMVRKSFTYAEGFQEAVEEYFQNLPDTLLAAKEFSNARFVRNLFERTWGKAVLRAQLAKEETVVLAPEDLRLAGSEREFSKIMEKPKQKRTLGFV